MRLGGGDTPAARAVYLAAAQTYERFVVVASIVLTAATAHMPLSPPQQQKEDDGSGSEAADIEVNAIELSCSCVNVARTGRILLQSVADVQVGDQPCATARAFEALSPVYTEVYPPPFQDLAKRGEEDAPAYALRNELTREQASIHRSDETRSQSPSQLSSKSVPSFGSPQQSARLNPFQARTDVLRVKAESLVAALCEVASRGEIAQLRALVAGASIDGCDEQGRTAPMCAVLNRPFEAAQFLVAEPGCNCHVMSTRRVGSQRCRTLSMRGTLDGQAGHGTQRPRRPKRRLEATVLCLVRSRRHAGRVDRVAATPRPCHA